MIEFIGKSLLIDKEILVIGDLHLGYGEALRMSGVYLPSDLYEVVKKDLELLFSRVGSVKEIVFLGDIKHAIGAILREERSQLVRLFDFLHTYSKKITIIKGNHDALLEPLLRDFTVTLTELYVYKSFAFIHGDKDFTELNTKAITTWVMGHMHPAVTLREYSKSETYKCFLVGSYKKKKVIILPSFFPFSEGSDPRESHVKLPWEFNLSSFEVKIVGENLEALSFGQLKKIN